MTCVAVHEAPSADSESKAVTVVTGDAGGGVYCLGFVEPKTTAEPKALYHIDIIGGKIWIQHDGTSPGVAMELAENGIPKEDIILGFRPAHLRQHTGFGIG